MKKNNFKILKFNELSLNILNENNNSIIGIEKNGIIVYINLKIKKNNKNLIVFSNGAINLQKSKPPVFSRSSWSNDFNSSCIYIDDATIHDTNMTVGWGVGRQDRYYLLDYIDIINKISALLNVQNENIVLFGSSAGGFMSIMMAIHIKGAVAIANNPQIWVRKETQASRAQNLYNSVFPGLNENEISSRFGDRLSIIKAMERENYIPKTYYILNRYSTKDLVEQYNPFIEYLDSKNDLDNDTEIISYHSSNGHNGIYSRNQTVQLINSYFGRLEKVTGQNSSDNEQNLNILKIYNENNDIVERLKFNNIIYLPKEFIKKDYCVSYGFKISYKKARLKLKLLSEYYNPSNANKLFYDIFVNNNHVLTEDMSKWQLENLIYLNNLNIDDFVEIKVRANQDNMLESWSKASKLKIIEMEEEITSILFNNELSYTSPHTLKI